MLLPETATFGLLLVVVKTYANLAVNSARCGPCSVNNLALLVEATTVLASSTDRR